MIIKLDDIENQANFLIQLFASAANSKFNSKRNQHSDSTLFYLMLESCMKKKQTNRTTSYKFVLSVQPSKQIAIASQKNIKKKK